jgi:hypothetical protein
VGGCSRTILGRTLRLDRRGRAACQRVQPEPGVGARLARRQPRRRCELRTGRCVGPARRRCEARRPGRQRQLDPDACAPARQSRRRCDPTRPMHLERRRRPGDAGGLARLRPARRPPATGRALRRRRIRAHQLRAGGGAGSDPRAARESAAAPRSRSAPR